MSIIVDTGNITIEIIDTLDATVEKKLLPRKTMFAVGISSTKLSVVSTLPT